jgi:hypothetical protein
MTALIKDTGTPGGCLALCRHPLYGPVNAQLLTLLTGVTAAHLWEAVGVDAER